MSQATAYRVSRFFGPGAAALSEVKNMVVYREPVTGPRSPGIVHRKSAINNKLAHKPAPKPTPEANPNPTLTLP